ncbi:hypothetical protein VPH35_020695 [Triticum aestivum]
MPGSALDPLSSSRFLALSLDPIESGHRPSTAGRPQEHRTLASFLLDSLAARRPSFSSAAPRGLRAPVAAPSIGDPSNRATSQPLRHPSRSPSSHRPSPSLRGELFQGEELLSCSCMPLPPSTANPLTSLAPPEPKFGAASPP